MAWDKLASPVSRYFFWRTAAGAEVDLVIERGDQVVAVEVKATTTLTRRETTGLRALQGDVGERFRMGIIAHLGTETRVLGDRLVAVPLASLLGAGRIPSSETEVTVDRS